jgi:hypothetical protein
MRKKNRNYKKEYKDYHSKPKQKKRRAQRNAARRKMAKSGAVKKGDGKDVNHRNRNTADNSRKNLQVTSQKQNRGWRKGK